MLKKKGILLPFEKSYKNKLYQTPVILLKLSCSVFINNDF